MNNMRGPVITAGGTSPSQGFTIVELAIVILVISMILAAIAKGTGVLDNTRGLQFTRKIMDAATAQHGYFANMGHFAGANPDSGAITTANPETELRDYEPSYSGTFSIPPIYRIRYGNWRPENGAPSTPMLAVCRDNGAVFDSRDLMFAHYFDTRIDDTSDTDASGRLRKARGGRVFNWTDHEVCGDTAATIIGDAGAASQDAWLEARGVRAVIYLFNDGYLR